MCVKKKSKPPTRIIVYQYKKYKKPAREPSEKKIA